MTTPNRVTSSAVRRLVFTPILSQSSSSCTRNSLEEKLALAIQSDQQRLETYLAKLNLVSIPMESLKSPEKSWQSLPEFYWKCSAKCRDAGSSVLCKSSAPNLKRRPLAQLKITDMFPKKKVRTEAKLKPEGRKNKLKDALAAAAEHSETKKKARLEAQSDWLSQPDRCEKLIKASTICIAPASNVALKPGVSV